MTRHPVEIKEEAGVPQRHHWRASPGKVEHVKLGDYIEWTSKGSDITLFFPDKRLVGGHFYYTKAGDPLTLEIVGDVPADKYPYAVFCHTDQDFAEGESSPIIIIEKADA